MRRTVVDGLSLMMMLNVPATAGLLVLAVPDRAVIFERAAFTPADTAATAAALQFYAIGLVGYSVVRIASPVFYALGENRTPVKVSIATVVVNAVLNVILVRMIGYRGLALGTSIAALFNATLLMVLLRRRRPGGRTSGLVVRAHCVGVNRHGRGGCRCRRRNNDMGAGRQPVSANCPARSVDRRGPWRARSRRTLPPHSGVPRRRGDGDAKASSSGHMRQRFGLHPTVLLLASTHFLVDGFSNIRTAASAAHP